MKISDIQMCDRFYFVYSMQPLDLYSIEKMDANWMILALQCLFPFNCTMPGTLTVKVNLINFPPSKNFQKMFSFFDGL